MAQRDFHKSELKSARSASDDVNASFHDSMQYAVKILMNSFYGVFASEFYRFTHRDLGSSITAWARHNIKMIIEEVEKEGHPVVYSDTDSIFVKSPMSEKSLEFYLKMQRMMRGKNGSKPSKTWLILELH